MRNNLASEGFATCAVHAGEHVRRHGFIPLTVERVRPDDGDGCVYFCDVNALSNFVTDAERILGFNPYEKLVDFIEEQLARLHGNLKPDRDLVQEKF